MIAATVSYIVLPGYGDNLFPFVFPIMSTDDAALWYRDVNDDLHALVYNIHYTFTPGPSGFITLIGLPGSTPDTLPILPGTFLIIRRMEIVEQTTPLSSASKFNPTTLELSFDALTRMVQDVAVQNGKSIHAPDGEPDFDGVLAAAPDRASTIVAFDANGDLYHIALADVLNP